MPLPKQRQCCSTIVSGDMLRDLSVFLEEFGDEDAVALALTKPGRNIVLDRTIAKDTAELGMRTKRCTALVGGYVTTPDMLSCSRGPLLLYAEARQVPRAMWSPRCSLQDSEGPVARGVVALVRKGEEVQGNRSKAHDVESFLKLVAKVHCSRKHKL